MEVPGPEQYQSGSQDERGRRTSCRVQRLTCLELSHAPRLLVDVTCRYADWRSHRHKPSTEGEEHKRSSLNATLTLTRFRRPSSSVARRPRPSSLTALNNDPPPDGTIMPSAPSSPLTPSVFSPTTTATTVTSTPVPALTPTTLSHRRNRAGSTSGVDLGPYRVLLSSLEDAAKEHGEQKGADAGREGEVVGALRMLLDHVDGLVSC